MAPFDDFVHISTGPLSGSGSSTSEPGVPADYYDNAQGKRWSTIAMLARSIQSNHPKHHLTITSGYQMDLIGFGNASEDVTYSIRGNPAEAIIVTSYTPPARRYNDENGGALGQSIQYGCYNYVYNGQPFIIYIAFGSEGSYIVTSYNYILVEDSDNEGTAAVQEKANELIAVATSWLQQPHEEVLVFDQSIWRKNKELWLNVQKANWEDVILEKQKKDEIIEDVIGFFNSREKYEEYNVPWKRGVIFHGPPGNGKTISTKALMKDVLKKKDPSVECLYVKTFKTYAGPEYGIRQIFLKARQMAPCILIFEDIDSLVSPEVRSYFLNEVDGLESNHGILMVGSTNFLERLDPGIAKRPSRFDRKYLFDDPTRDERVQYSEYWRNKLRDNKNIDFPKELSTKIADITGNFSFAYMKEAFVATLLVLAGKNGKENQKKKTWENSFRENIFWEEMKKQVENLRKEMDENDESSGLNMMSGMWPAMSNILDEESPATKPMNIRDAMPRYM